jgi:hypothetical protein
MLAVEIRKNTIVDSVPKSCVNVGEVIAVGK